MLTTALLLLSSVIAGVIGQSQLFHYERARNMRERPSFSRSGVSNNFIQTRNLVSAQTETRPLNMDPQTRPLNMDQLMSGFSGQVFNYFKNMQQNPSGNSARRTTQGQSSPQIQSASQFAPATQSPFQYDQTPKDSRMDTSFGVTADPVPDCPLEQHPDTETMFIVRGPLGDPEPRTCPPRTYFLRTLCSCVNRPIDKCHLRPSPLGPGYYEEDVFGLWMSRPCGPGSGFNPATCECSMVV